MIFIAKELFASAIAMEFTLDLHSLVLLSHRGCFLRQLCKTKKWQNK